MKVFQQLWHGGNLYYGLTGIPWSVSTAPSYSGIVGSPMTEGQIEELIEAFAGKLGQPGECTVKKFVNHVDHVAYVSSWENLDANIAHLEAVTGASLMRTERPEQGAMICVDWSAGLEVVAPLPDNNPAGDALRDRLASHGEGVVAVIYGVENLEEHKANLEAKGYQMGPLMGGQRDQFWTEILLRERFGPAIMGTWTVFSEIDYEDHLIHYVDVREGARVA
ncbi:MAG: hypothetical protein ABIQ66_01955 [Novosphingobium sp.]